MRSCYELRLLFCVLAAVKSFRHRIVSTLGKRAAAHQALHSQPRTAPRAKSLNRFVRVFRAGGSEPATAAKKRPEKNLIHAHTQQGEPLRGSVWLHADSRFCSGSSDSSSASSFVNSSVAAARLGCITMSHPGAISSRCNRKTSRTRLRIRFRTTAFPSAFLTLMPKRPRGKLFLRAKTTNVAPARRRPSR